MIWTPVSVSSSKPFPKEFSITRTKYNKLLEPSWLNGNIIDFMMQYLLRGSFPGDHIYAAVDCCVYSWVEQSLFRLQKKTRQEKEYLKLEMVLWPVRINGIH